MPLACQTLQELNLTNTRTLSRLTYSKTSIQKSTSEERFGLLILVSPIALLWRLNQIFTSKWWNLQKTKRGFPIKKMALRWTRTAASRIFEVHHRFKTYFRVKTSPCSLNPDLRWTKESRILRRSNAPPSSKRKIQRYPSFKCLVKASSINANCAQRSSKKELRLAAMSRRSILVNPLSTT